MAFWTETPLEEANALRAQRGVPPLTAADREALILQSRTAEREGRQRAALTFAAIAAGAYAGASAGGAGAGGGEAVSFDYSYLDALEAGDAFYGNEVFVGAAEVVAPAAAPGFWDKVSDAGLRLGEKYLGAEIASQFAPSAPSRDLLSRPMSAPGVPLVRYSGQSGDLLGTLLSPAGLKVLLSLGGLVLIGAVAYKAVQK